jgi:hypothetical protein
MYAAGPTMLQPPSTSVVAEALSYTKRVLQQSAPLRVHDFSENACGIESILVYRHHRPQPSISV